MVLHPEKSERAAGNFRSRWKWLPGVLIVALAVLWLISFLNALPTLIGSSQAIAMMALVAAVCAILTLWLRKRAG